MQSYMYVDTIITQYDCQPAGEIWFKSQDQGHQNLLSTSAAL